MSTSRSARMDRRRRVLRETVEEDPQPRTASGRGRRGTAQVSEAEGIQGKRKAGYSQDVRKACGQRLVQLIPVRKRTFAAAILLSVLVPAVLLTAHYLIFVSGQLRWWGHPLATALDIGHPRSIAAWLSSQLWLLCLTATVLTFQLRRHKLDDYNGEYRLWSWMVLTCLVASIDATTNITDLFAQALDRWTQLNLGWTGPAVVQSTLAVLIGMLGLRLCTELKSVPLSLIFWLIGLVAWAGSAALGRPELKLEMSAPIRYWLHSGLWLGGLTAIWLAALSYLRNIYIEAQRRFLLRGRMTASGTPLGQRLRQHMPKLPAMPRFSRRDRSQDNLDSHDDEQTERRGRWSLPSFRPRPADGDEAEQVPSRKSAGRNARGGDSRADQEDSTAEESPTQASSRRGLGGFLRRSRPESDGPDRDGEEAPQRPPATASRWTGWGRKPKHSDDAEEYRKVAPPTRPAPNNARTDRGAEEDHKAQADEEQMREGRPRRRFLPKLGRPKLPALPKPKIGGWFPKIRLPKLKLPSLRLPPPVDSDASERPAHKQSQELRTVDPARQMPGTNAAHNDHFDEPDLEDGRTLSKAERKRQRRQQQNRRAA